MSSSIAARQLAAWDRVWSPPRGKWITVTAVSFDGDMVTVYGVITGTQQPIKIRVHADTIVTVED